MSPPPQGEKDRRAPESGGYRYVAVDLGGFRSGSLNEGLIDVVQVYDAPGASGNPQAGAA